MGVQQKFATLGQGDSRICIAVLDGPVDLSHPCFQGANVTSTDALLKQNCARGPALAHGTHVASIIFGQSESEVIGVAPSCRGLLIPIFMDQGPGESLGCSQLDLARAILVALENGAHVINISSGQLSPSGEPEPFLAQAIETCAKRNVLIVAAAGNDGCECLHVPAAGRTVLAVGAVDQNGIPVPSSNWGGRYQNQGILALGIDVLGAAPGGGTARKSGTSFATPLVSGVVGLLASLQIERGETPDPHAIGAALLNTAIPCPLTGSDDCKKFLAGRLNIQGAIENLTSGDQTMTKELTGREETMSTIVASSDALPEMITPTVGETRAAIENGAVCMSEDIGAPAVSKSTIAPGGRATGQVAPSECGCGGGANCTCGGGQQQKPALVYAFGKLGVDFGTDTRRDSFIQHMPPQANDPNNPAHLIPYLKSDDSNFEAESLIWVLKLDETPIYAILPAGAYAERGYQLLLQFYEGQFDKNNPVDLVSIPGTICGSVRLRTGEVVPLVKPKILGMFAWNSHSLLEHVLGKRPALPEGAKATQAEDAKMQEFDRQMTLLSNFINRIYYDQRNLGLTAEDRALNFAATNVVQTLELITKIQPKISEFELDTICVRKSSICRQGGECYDVKLCFFDPGNTNRGDYIAMFTLDVSEVIPVSLGPSRSWFQRITPTTCQ